ncbi:uncharacterized protein DFL_002487 [Arthrobotrys flagrans]|uniref:Uncharacterized protein n=1 Tax=Arthrobotrys flagrans TaxID=97331 RepID=A0A437AB21_ARTFL|nr:hypothetical protein DFL_002487 [Arthrobotrys flagrans]
MGGRSWLGVKRRKEAAAGVRPETETDVYLEDQNTEEIEIAPTKVQLSEGNQGFRVRRLGDSNGPTNADYQNLRAANEADSISGPLDLLASRQGQEFNTRISKNINDLNLAEGATGLDGLRGMVRELQQKYLPLNFPALSGSQGHGRPEIQIPVARYPRIQEGKIQVPPLAQVYKITLMHLGNNHQSFSEI